MRRWTEPQDDRLREMYAQAHPSLPSPPRSVDPRVPSWRADGRSECLPSAVADRCAPGSAPPRTAVL